MSGVIYKDRRDADQVEHTNEYRRSIVIKRLARLSRDLDRFDCYLQTRERVSYRRGYEPAPHGAIVRGSIEDYRDHLPMPSDLSCVIHISDKWLEYDRTSRLEDQAEVGIPTYVIINLVDRVVEIYAQPEKREMRWTYASRSTFHVGGEISLPTPGGKHWVVNVDQLLS